MNNDLRTVVFVAEEYSFNTIPDRFNSEPSELLQSSVWVDKEALINHLLNTGYVYDTQQKEYYKLVNSIYRHYWKITPHVLVGDLKDIKMVSESEIGF